MADGRWQLRHARPTPSIPIPRRPSPVVRRPSVHGSPIARRRANVQKWQEFMEETTMFICALCGEEFSTTQQLQLHRVEDHSLAHEAAESRLEFESPSPDQEHGEVF